jgi:hypothetical protein
LFAASAAELQIDAEMTEIAAWLKRLPQDVCIARSPLFAYDLT